MRRSRPNGPTSPRDIPAFPGDWATPGMTYRQWLIGQVANGLAANPQAWEVSDATLTVYAVDFADAIIQHLAQENSQ